VKTASAAEVKAHFGAYLKASEKGPIVVTRNRKPVAILSAMTDKEELERLAMAYSPRLQEILEAARKRINAGEGIPHDEFWAEVKREQGTKKRAGKLR
jgi:prevent-host-death family protein